MFSRYKEEEEIDIVAFKGVGGDPPEVEHRERVVREGDGVGNCC